MHLCPWSFSSSWSTDFAGIGTPYCIYGIRGMDGSASVQQSNRSQGSYGLESRVPVPLSAGIPWPPTRVLLGPEHFVVMVLELRALTRTEVGGYLVESTVQDEWFSCLCDHRLGVTKGKPGLKHVASTYVDQNDWESLIVSRHRWLMGQYGQSEFKAMETWECTGLADFTFRGKSWCSTTIVCSQNKVRCEDR